MWSLNHQVVEVHSVCYMAYITVCVLSDRLPDESVAGGLG